LQLSAALELATVPPGFCKIVGDIPAASRTAKKRRPAINVEVRISSRAPKIDQSLIIYFPVFKLVWLGGMRACNQYPSAA
jgi:hypothetical protein